MKILGIVNSDTPIIQDKMKKTDPLHPLIPPVSKNIFTYKQLVLEIVKQIEIYHNLQGL